MRELRYLTFSLLLLWAPLAHGSLAGLDAIETSQGDSSGFVITPASSDDGREQLRHALVPINQFRDATASQGVHACAVLMLDAWIEVVRPEGRITVTDSSTPSTPFLESMMKPS